MTIPLLRRRIMWPQGWGVGGMGTLGPLPRAGSSGPEPGFVREARLRTAVCAACHSAPEEYSSATTTGAAFAGIARNRPELNPGESKSAGRSGDWPERKSSR
jgi:hypothetical protein